MTLALEHGPAGESTLTDREKHLAEWVEALAVAAKAHRQVTVDEIAAGIPALEEARSKAAAVQHEAWKARQGPERDIAALDAEIAAAEADRAKWQAKLSDETPREERARARFQHAECESDITRLSRKRDFAQAQLQPLLDIWNKARTERELADAAVSGRELNATLELAYFGAGQKTAAYGMRFGLALENTLRDRDDPEHDAAVEYMLHLCQVSGFRTEDHADELPSDAEQARRFWDQVHADAVAGMAADPAPSAAGVMKQFEAEVENMALQGHPSEVSDYRDPRTAVPRAVPERDYMQVPNLRDMGLR